MKKLKKTGGNKVVKRRVKMMEEWGEQGVLERFLEVGSIRKFCFKYFTPHSESPDALPGTSAFYAWLDAGGPERREWWRQVRHRRAEDYADSAQWRLDTADEENVRLRAEQAKQDRWHASVLDRENYGQGPQVNIQNTHVTLGETLAAALQEIEANKSREILVAEVLEPEEEEQ